MPDWIIQMGILIVAFGAFLVRQDKAAGERFARLETKVDDLRGEQEEYKTLKDRVTKVEDRSASNTHRIDDLYSKRRCR